MDKELAREILKVFDTPQTVDVIRSYADVEINKANKNLHHLTDPVEIYRLQGVVRAMMNLKMIRDQAVSIKDN